MRCKKIRWRNSLSVQLLATCVIALVLSIVCIMAMVKYIFNTQANMMNQQHLTKNAINLSRNIRFNTTGKPIALSLPASFQWLYETLPNDFQYRVTDANGQVLLSSSNSFQPLIPNGQIFNPHRTSFRYTSNNQSLSVVTIPLNESRGQYFLQAANSDRLMKTVQKAVIDPIADTATITTGTAVFVFAIVMLLTLQRLLRPLREVSIAAAGITPRNMQLRLSKQNIPAEILPLIEAFNQALERLEKGYKVQQEFLASAAHELKTPLALMRSQIEMEENLIGRTILLQDVDLMARHVHQLLHLAEVSEVQNYTLAPTNMNHVAQEVTGYLERYAQRHQVTIYLEMSDVLKVVMADRCALFILLKNLLENAILHSPAQSAVTLIVNSDCIQVCDEGSGITKEHLPMIFTRFWRAPNRPYEGAGLGLAICQEIAQAHSWKLYSQELSQGALFILEFSNPKASNNVNNILI